MTPSQVRQFVRREVDKLQPLIKGVAHIKTAADMADGLPDRGADQDAHDVQVRALHTTVKTARSSLEEHLRGAARALRLVGFRRGSGSGPSGPSGTDHDKPYDNPGDGLTRAKAAIGDAEQEADHFLDDVLEGGDEAAISASANSMHGHVTAADEGLQDYRASVCDNPEGKSRRARARAFAAAAVAIINPGSGAA